MSYQGNQGGFGEESAPNPPRQVNIQPGEAIQLVQALKNEVAAVKQAESENDRARAQEHKTKAERIRNILLMYQAQQQQQRIQQAQQGQLVQSPQAPTSASPPTADLMQRPGTVDSGMGSLLPQLDQRQVQTSGYQAPNVDPAVVIDRIKKIDAKIKQLEAAKTQDVTPEQVTVIDRQVAELRKRLIQEHKLAQYSKNQLEQNNMNQNATTLASSAASPPHPNAIFPNAASQSPAAAVQAQNNVRGRVPDQQGKSPMPRTSAQSPVGTPGSSGNSANKPVRSQSPGGTNATATPNKSSLGSTTDLAGITKPSVPLMPILSTLNVKTPTAITLKPNAQNRASLTGGTASDFGSVLGTPSITKIPSFELSNSSAGAARPDNNGRVVSKRKLSELVNSIGADEGDGRTVIDGDVEELLLDLADEFVNSVTSFACRLARHRRADSIDVRDVQLHLERNWNIRIPGFAMDEIKAIRKWQPSSSYSQKLSGLEISKSVNSNIN